MLNLLWAAMIAIGIIYAALTGNMAAVSDGILSSAKEAVSLCITMLGVMALWTGLMEIATKSGLIARCTKMIAPFMEWLFPGIPAESEAMQYMTTNVIANMFGLGWAATPAGLKAMEALRNQDETGLAKKGVATDAMCTFLVMNISCLQLIPVNMIAYRSQYGSANPTGIIVPALIANLINTVIAIAFCKIACGMKKGRCRS